MPEEGLDDLGNEWRVTGGVHQRTPKREAEGEMPERTLQAQSSFSWPFPALLQPLTRAWKDCLNMPSRLGRQSLISQGSILLTFSCG